MNVYCEMKKKHEITQSQINNEIPTYYRVIVHYRNSVIIYYRTIHYILA